MRGRMNAGKSYVPPFELGKALNGGAVGEVSSPAPGIQAGDAVTSSYGWREYLLPCRRNCIRLVAKFSPSQFTLAPRHDGHDAWAGLNLVDVKAGDVIFISGAAGAVGNVAGQLAKLRGCLVIGAAGSAEKVKFLREECGFDIAFNYKTGPIPEQLHLAWLAGIDVYFDNVVAKCWKRLSRITCAWANHRLRGISGYNDETPRPGLPTCST